MRQQKHRAWEASRAVRVGVVALGLGAVAATAGCGTGQIAQTAEEQPAVNGAASDVGALAVRDGVLVYPGDTHGAYPEGADAELALTIVSQGVTDDRLVRVTAPAASNVTVEGARTVPGNGALVVGQPDRSGSGGARPEEAHGQSSTQRSSTRHASGGTTRTPATTADSESGGARDDHARIVLNGLTTPIGSGQAAEVTFTFRDAGSVTVDMPIAVPSEGNYTRDGGHGSGEGGGSEGGGH